MKDQNNYNPFLGKAQGSPERLLAEWKEIWKKSKSSWFCTMR
jgi:hypothetical protein